MRLCVDFPLCIIEAVISIISLCELQYDYRSMVGMMDGDGATILYAVTPGSPSFSFVACVGPRGGVVRRVIYYSN